MNSSGQSRFRDAYFGRELILGEFPFVYRPHQIREFHLTTSSNATCFILNTALGWTCPSALEERLLIEKCRWVMELQLLRMLRAKQAGGQDPGQTQLSQEDTGELLLLFLSWLLDARWFPQSDAEVARSRKAELTKFRRLRARMKAFSDGKLDATLVQGMVQWEDYGKTLESSVKQVVQRAPALVFFPEGKSESIIAGRLLCATLIIPRLYPGRKSIYSMMQRFLADPKSLPRLITLADDNTKELDGTDGGSLFTALQGEFRDSGREMPLRPYSRSEKSLQSSVARLRAKMKSGKTLPIDWVLESNYLHYLWAQWGRPRILSEETKMLKSLLYDAR